jgi:ankyrin repeat protein
MRFFFVLFFVYPLLAWSQIYSPQDQEKLRKAGLPLLPSALPIAAATGNIDLVKTFLDAGIPVDIRDGEGRTPLLLALESSVLQKLSEPRRAEMLRNKIAVARLLLERGADARLKSNKGFNALHTAAHLGEMAELMELLIAKGADVHGVDAIWFRTPLFVAAGASDLRPMEVLLKHGADPNKPDLKKWTPIMLAVLGKNTATAARLIRAGADPNLPNQDGVTAIQLASQPGSGDLVEILRTAR